MERARIGPERGDHALFLRGEAVDGRGADPQQGQRRQPERRPRLAIGARGQAQRRPAGAPERIAAAATAFAPIPAAVTGLAACAGAKDVLDAGWAARFAAGREPGIARGARLAGFVRRGLSSGVSSGAWCCPSRSALPGYRSLEAPRRCPTGSWGRSWPEYRKGRRGARRQSTKCSHGRCYRKVWREKQGLVPKFRLLGANRKRAPPARVRPRAKDEIPVTVDEATVRQAIAAAVGASGFRPCG
jgi:hypothetical protein